MKDRKFYNKNYQEMPYFTKKHQILTDKQKNDVIKNLINKYKNTDKQIYNKISQKRYIGIVNTHYMMTSSQKSFAKDIIENVDLRKLYRGGKGRKIDDLAIVTAICFYCMKKDNPRRPLPYNTKFLREVKLNKDIYNVIANNIDKQLDSLYPDNSHYKNEGEKRITIFRFFKECQFSFVVYNSFLKGPISLYNTI